MCTRAKCILTCLSTFGIYYKFQDSTTASFTFELVFYTSVNLYSRRVLLMKCVTSSKDRCIRIYLSTYLDGAKLISFNCDCKSFPNEYVFKVQKMWPMRCMNSIVLCVNLTEKDCKWTLWINKKYLCCLTMEFVFVMSIFVFCIRVHIVMLTKRSSPNC